MDLKQPAYGYPVIGASKVFSRRARYTSILPLVAQGGTKVAYGGNHDGSQWKSLWPTEEVFRAYGGTQDGIRHCLSNTCKCLDRFRVALLQCFRNKQIAC